MYAHIKYCNPNIKSNYSRFGVTFRDIEKEYDIIKDFKCEEHQFVAYDKTGKKKYWKDADKRAKFILAQLMADRNLEVIFQKGADEHSKKIYEEVLLQAKQMLGREELTDTIPKKQDSERELKKKMREIELKLEKISRK